jgi:hypothetical protein
MDRLPLRVDGVDDAVETALEEVPEDEVADARLAAPRTDDGDSPWCEELVEVANAHRACRAGLTSL